MAQSTSTTVSTSAIEFLIYFVLAWVFGATYLFVTTGSLTDGYPWMGASLAVVVATLPLVWSAHSPALKLLRIATPLIILSLFASRAVGESGGFESFQKSVGALHFLFLFAVTFFAVQHNPQPARPVRAKSSPSKKPEVRRKPQPRPNAAAFDRIIGQPRAVQSLEEIANVVRSGIRVGKSNAPHAVLLFLGPTGVGKTEAARALAQAVYGRDDALIRFDMGQFTDAHQANRFYGPPPGYVGSEQGGQLTQAVHKMPKAIVLLDEVEKAHPQIWDAFLPVFDEGYIVDGSTNQKVDMTNTIIVLTSNLLADSPGAAQMNPSEIKDAVRDTGAFRPELVGRINEVLVFDALNNDTIAEILRRRVDSSLWSLSDQGLSIEISDEDINMMVSDVKEAKYGVRQIDDVVRGFLRKKIAEQQTPTSVED